MSTISIRNVRKVYAGGVTALDGVSLEVNNGEIFGLLGPNGAGKTTLVKAMLTIIHPTDGDIHLFNQPNTDPSVRRQVGYLPENHRYPVFLTGEDVLRYYGGLSGMDTRTMESRMDSLLKLVSMDTWRSVRIKKYSKGMMQRIGLAQALMCDPAVLVLDEPTDGIDPVGRREIHDILKKLRDEGRTIFINSHMLAEIESVCDRVAILKKGKLMRVGSVAEITTTEHRYIIQFDYPEDAFMALLNELEADVTLETPGVAAVGVSDMHELNGLIDKLRARQVLIRAVFPKKQSLEDSFINVIKEDN